MLLIYQYQKHILLIHPRYGIYLPNVLDYLPDLYHWLIEIKNIRQVKHSSSSYTTTEIDKFVLLIY
jgi:hypothetical protein